MALNPNGIKSCSREIETHEPFHTRKIQRIVRRHSRTIPTRLQFFDQISEEVTKLCTTRRNKSNPSSISCKTSRLVTTRWQFFDEIREKIEEILTGSTNRSNPIVDREERTMGNLPAPTLGCRSESRFPIRRDGNGKPYVLGGFAKREQGVGAHTGMTDEHRSGSLKYILIIIIIIMQCPGTEFFFISLPRKKNLIKF